MNFTADTDIVGDDVVITLTKFAGRVNISATGVRRALAKKDVYEDAYFTRTITGSVSAATYHIGDAAAGISLDIAADGTARSVNDSRNRSDSVTGRESRARCRRKNRLLWLVHFEPELLLAFKHRNQHVHAGLA